MSWIDKLKKKQNRRAFIGELNEMVASLKTKHGVSDIDMATRLMWSAATLYMKNEVEAGREATEDDFASFARASFLVIAQVARERQ